MPTPTYEKCGKETSNGPCDRIIEHRGICTPYSDSAEHLDAADPEGPKRPADGDTP